MNKNLKKVISAVAALAMSASTFVAFAANYPDVDASASYKQAVDELSALNIINGYDDGTFQPDKLVNRAEFAKMVITAKGKAEIAQAEAAANKDTEFTDVKGDHWAAGWISAAVTNKIINGMGDGTFAPEANITYAQAMKMLVCAAGYEQWSIDNGGWPTGYMYWGNQLDLGNGVKDVVQDTEITRAQCAQMIDNVLNAAVCVETGKMSFDMYGNQYKELEKKDGYGIDFQSILTKQHDAYKVKGMVTGTHRSGDSDTDKVAFTIMNARNWNDEEDKITKADSVVINALIGDSEADKFIHKYVEAIIAVDEDDEYEILSISQTAQNDEFTLSAADYDSEETFNSEKMYILQNGKSSSKKIASDAKMFVNGVEVGYYTEPNVNEYIVNNNVGNVTLIDTPGETNATDGKYDYIMVDYYKTAVVDSVNVVDDETIEISMAGGDTAVMDELAVWTIDLSDEDTTYDFTVDGTAVDASTLGAYDVLSIQADPDNLSKSNFYDVTVAKAEKAVSGTVGTVEDAEEAIDTEYVVDGTTYKIAYDSLSDLKAGDSYTFYVDAFGRIAYTDELATDKKIAILDVAYENQAGKKKAELILADGSTLEVDIRETGDNFKNAKKIVYTNGESGAKKPVEERVVEYTINKNNELTIKNNGEALSYKSGTDLEYRASYNRFGSYTIDPETTSFINAESEDDITTMSASTFTDGNEYEAYFFDRSTSTSVYRFVIVKTGAGAYTPTTNVAVVKKVQSTTDEDTNDAVTALSVVVGGEDKVVKVDSSLEDDARALGEGDMIVYSTDGTGYINDFKKIVDMDFSANSAYLDMFDKVITNDEVEKILDAKGEVAGELSNPDNEVTFAFGPIIDETDTSITIGEVETATEAGITLKDEAYEGNVSDTGVDMIAYDPNVKFTTINYNGLKGSRVAGATNSAVIAMSLSRSLYADEDNTFIGWGNLSAKTNPRFALVKMVEGDATDVVVIVPKTGLERN